MDKIFKLSQLRKNIFSGSIVHGLNILVTFIGYPIYIRFLGFELFSVWTILSVIISFAQLGDFGIGKSIIYFVSKAKAENNNVATLTIIINAIIIILFISLVIQSALWIFDTKIAQLFAIPKSYYVQSVAVIPLIGFAVFTYLMYDAFTGIITGMGRIDISNIMLLALNISKVTITILLLYLSPTLYSMAYGVLISNFFFIFLISVILIHKKYLPVDKLPQICVSRIKELIAYGIPLFGIQVLNILMFPVIKIVISNIFGVSFVGYFELAQKAAYSIRTLFQKGLFALLPEFAQASNFFNDISARNNLKTKVKNITKVLIFYGVPFFLVVALISKYLLIFWLGDEYNEEVLYGYLLFQPGIILGMLALPSYYALMAINKPNICFNEALLRLILVSLLFLLFLLTDLNFKFVFVFISISLLISNLYVVLFFFKEVGDNSLFKK